jgi:hypothetical protein
MEDDNNTIHYSFINNIIFIIIIPIVIYLVVLFADMITDLVNPNKNYDSLIYFYINFFIIILLLAFLRSFVNNRLIKNYHLLSVIFIIAGPMILFHSKYFKIMKNINFLNNEKKNNIL